MVIDAISQSNAGVILDSTARDLLPEQGWCLINLVDGKVTAVFNPRTIDGNLDTIVESAIAWITSHYGDAYLTHLNQGEPSTIMSVYYGDDTSYGRMQRAFEVPRND